MSSTCASCAVLLMVRPITPPALLLKLTRLLLMAVEGCSRRGVAYTNTSWRVDTLGEKGGGTRGRGIGRGAI